MMSYQLRREPIKTFLAPNPKEAAEVIMSATSRRHALAVFGVCSIRYRGRASSALGEGERIVMVKEDGAVLVHQVWGHKPVNYQPPGSLVFARAKADSVEVHATTRSGREAMEVEMSKVYLIVEMNFSDNSLIELNGTEAQMRESVVYSPELIEKDLKVITHEFNMKSGFVDLLALDSRDRLVAIEFKRLPAKTSDVNQLLAYVSRLRANAKRREVRGVLAAPSVTKSARKLLVESKLEFKALDPRRCIEIVEGVASSVNLLKYINNGKPDG
ncbi:MAG: endonuclease NucS [Candidatus Marsarchaeota archaeon]|nr:endonuclease NucS [Candidatus Marsarchaeota archaeon]